MTHDIVLVYKGLAGNLTVGHEPPVGAYLASYDPDAYDGRGDAGWTTDVTKAMRFRDVYDALTCWKLTSTVRPLRADGKPNRPLTAVSVGVVVVAGL